MIVEYGDQASFALALLGDIAAKTERKNRAIGAWRKALNLNPFHWSSFENLCKIGDKPNPQNIFEISNVENFSTCHGTNINNIESVIIPNNTPNQDNSQEAYITTPQSFLCNFNSNLNANSPKMFTPEDRSLGMQAFLLSGCAPLSHKTKFNEVSIQVCKLYPISQGPDVTFGPIIIKTFSFIFR